MPTKSPLLALAKKKPPLPKLVGPVISSVLVYERTQATAYVYYPDIWDDHAGR